jgi:hypothetical protein
MSFDPNLSAAQHVARREALAQIARGGDLSQGLHTLGHQVMLPLGRQFNEGRRIDGASYARIVGEIRGILSAFGPPMLIERSLPATRAKPKGECHEFLTALRCSASADTGNSGYQLAGFRVHVSRRRIGCTYEPNGVFVTRHALERSIERGLSSWTARLADMEDAVLGRLGLLAVWRHALESGRISNPDVVLPYRDGLVLGTLKRSPLPRSSGGLLMSKARKDVLEGVPSPLLVDPALHAAGACTDTILCTAVDEDLLTIDQIDLRDALTRFQAIHADDLAAIRTSALWRDAILEQPRPCETLLAVLGTLADELAGLLGRPRAQDALNTRRRPREDAPPMPYLEMPVVEDIRIAA